MKLQCFSKLLLFLFIYIFILLDDVAEIAVTASEIDTTNLEITLADIAGVEVNFLGTTYTAGQVSLIKL